MRTFGCASAVLVGVGLFICAGMGFVAPSDFAFNLAVGWALFLYRVVPEIHVNWLDVGTAAGCLLVLAWGLHRMLKWLHAQTAATARSWPVSRTLAILGVVLLMFVAGTAAVGIVHQSSWLATSPEPVVEGGIRKASARTQAMNNLRWIAIACDNYRDANGDRLPAGCTVDRHGRAMHGWQTSILPYIEQGNLYLEIDKGLPWDDPRNAPGFRTVVKIYLHPGIPGYQDANGFALSHFAANVRVMGGTVPVGLKDLKAGAANTVLAAVAAGNYKPWGHPTNWRDPALGINRSPDGFGGPTQIATLAVMADGSVRTVSNRDEDLRRLGFEAADGEAP